jgi:predicted metal-dependent phosphoesterase TrpH
MYKCDLHTHSELSSDGGLTAKEYINLLNKKVLDVVAVTDHNQLRFALELHDQVGDQVIPGEEISSSDGHIIGLFLTDLIRPGLTAVETVKKIKQQGGVVYIPHPFETHRSGISLQVLEHISAEVDILEVFNARSLPFQSHLSVLKAFADQHQITPAAGSDAHGLHGVGTTYTISHTFPNSSQTLLDGLQEHSMKLQHASFFSRLDPTFNRLRKKLTRIFDHE